MKFLSKHFNRPKETLVDSLNGAEIWRNEAGDILWRLNGKLHRDDGPAVETLNGRKEWWKHGKRHRLEAAAVMQGTFSSQWWIDGIRYSASEHFMLMPEHLQKLEMGLKDDTPAPATAKSPPLRIMRPLKLRMPSATFARN